MTIRTNRERLEQKHFDILARRYDENYGYTKSYTQYKIRKKIKAFLKFIRKGRPPRSLNILEIGCGTGEYTKQLAPVCKNDRLTAIDLSSKMIALARRKTAGSKNIRYKVTSAYSTGYHDKEFDVVCAFYTLHHLDLKRVAAEIRRVLKPHGIAYFYEPNILNPLVYLIKSTPFIKRAVGDSANEWAINPWKIKKAFKGFKLINITFTGFIPPLYFLPLKMMILLDRLTDKIGILPGIKILGGSLEVIFTKKNQLK